MIRKLAQANFNPNRSLATKSYTFKDFVDKYPIAVQTPSRPPSLIENLNKAGWWEQTILVPGRRLLGNKAAQQFINNRFKEGNEQAPYLETQFLKGAETAIKVFFTLVEEDCNKAASSDTESISLADVLTPKLYAAFKKQHRLLKENGLELHVKLEKAASPVLRDKWCLLLNQGLCLVIRVGLFRH
jgi:hypothetical protein